MQEVSLEKCKWCNGTGNGSAHFSDTPYDCPDCEGTGYKHGKEALRYYDFLIDQLEKNALNGRVNRWNAK